MSQAPSTYKKVPIIRGSVTLEDLLHCPENWTVTAHFAEELPAERQDDLLGLKARTEDSQVPRDLHTVLLVAGAYRAVISSWGARLLSFSGPDGVEIVVGPRQKDTLLADDSAMGAVVGRVANRIGRGSFTIPGQGTYQLPLNDGPHHLHGGPQGFHQRMWQVDFVAEGVESSQTFAEVSLSLTSPAGDQGYPGHAHVETRYLLSSNGSLTVNLFSHVKDAISPVNLTHHAYWNLSEQGRHGATCLNHFLFTPYGSYLETDLRHLPTGHILPVSETPYDFTHKKTLGADLPQTSESAPVGGYDVFLTNHAGSDKPLHHAPETDSRASKSTPLPIIACLEDEESRRRLEIRSDQPGFQLYTGNYLRGPYRQYQAVCIEPSGLVDAVNQPHFPSIMLQPGKTLRQIIEFRLFCNP
jgi:aldose 1-epimerase